MRTQEGVEGGALVVSVPTSPVRAQPGSDLLLGCHFSVGGTVDMELLVVQWKLGGRLVAEFDSTPSYPRAGASLSLEGLRVGNASLLLPRVGGADAGLYTCMVIHSPSRESRQVELRVEDPAKLPAEEPEAVAPHACAPDPDPLVLEKLDQALTLLQQISRTLEAAGAGGGGKA
ncbi:programmed cell death 1 ligand 1-like isoform X2 [Malaclemys terrapin pileata]|uniref:programmed cell death 1 ligand 1-like isoform X2 n=1 Tax=Malaclemys terrapin pileata TaxID=2991368 RepID=UPI0023A7DD42|nr:programmed cell death 1 ligand 1-like isoform X2 [Malaclemys terrapin pileata]XP_053883165.1 programmed cell death 1 ligand 1-like isoform X2 [Malaclemys terrapin pileata]